MRQPRPELLLSRPISRDIRSPLSKTILCTIASSDNRIHTCTHSHTHIHTHSLSLSFFLGSMSTHIQAQCDLARKTKKLSGDGAGVRVPLHIRFFFSLISLSLSLSLSLFLSPSLRKAHLPSASRASDDDDCKPGFTRMRKHRDGSGSLSLYPSLTRPLCPVLSCPEPCWPCMPLSSAPLPNRASLLASCDVTMLIVKVFELAG